MRNLHYSLFLLFATALLVSCSGKGASAASGSTGDDASKRYPFKSAIVEYVSSQEGSLSVGKGTKTLWIDNYGQNEATLTHEKTSVSMLGQTSESETHSLTIIDGNDGYNVDLLTKTAIKTNIEEMKQMGQAMALAFAKDLKTTSLKQFVEDNGGKWYGQETFLGKTCDVFEFMGTKQWQYNGITLKIEGNIAGMKMIETAVSIKEDVSIDSKQFKVPEGIAITEASSMDEMMKMAGSATDESNDE